MFICKSVFKIFAAHFKTKGMLHYDKKYLYEGDSQHGDTKNLLQKDVA